MIDYHFVIIALYPLAGTRVNLSQNTSIPLMSIDFAILAT